MSRWIVRTVEHGAAFLHASEQLFFADDPSGPKSASTGVMAQRHIAVCVPTLPALVLGSTQSLTDVDEAKAGERGIDLVRRRSGGGAVWLHPEHSVWIDIWIPRDDVLWHDDVSVAAHWVGDVWCEALTSLGVERLAFAPERVASGRVSAVTSVDSNRDELSVYRGDYVAGNHGRQICFVSAAAGEVFVHPRRDLRAAEPGSNDATLAGAYKAVGVSQRRTREGARFQCVLYRSWQPGEWADLFVDPLVTAAAHAVRVVTCDASADEVSHALVAAISGL